MNHAKVTHWICRIVGCSEERRPVGPLLLGVPSASKVSYNQQEKRTRRVATSTTVMVSRSFRAA